MERPVVRLVVALQEDSGTRPVAHAEPRPVPAAPVPERREAQVAAPLPGMRARAVGRHRPVAGRWVGRVVLREVGRPVRLRRDDPPVRPVVGLRPWARHCVPGPQRVSVAIRSKVVRPCASC